VLSAPRAALLVLAKAPVPGEVKTRLCPPATYPQAARIAAAAFRDTLDAVLAVPGVTPVVALTGDLARAVDSAALTERLRATTVLAQRGTTLGQRIAAAYADTAVAVGQRPVLQIGMDTPQVTAELLTDCARRLLDAPAVLGTARDGGWWVLGVGTPTMAGCLRAIPMSQPNTGELTLKALRDSGIDVAQVQSLADVDVLDDVAAVRAACGPASRFARVTRSAGL
jgi:uncharacterized protein